MSRHLQHIINIILFARNRRSQIVEVAAATYDEVYLSTTTASTSSSVNKNIRLPT